MVVIFFQPDGQPVVRAIPKKLDSNKTYSLDVMTTHHFINFFKR